MASTHSGWFLCLGMMTLATLASAQTNPAAPGAGTADPATAAAAQPGGFNPRDLSGMWEMRDIPGYGDYARVTAKAEMTPGGEAETQATFKKLMSEIAPGDAAWKSSRYCQPVGMPFLMGQSPPLDFVQTSNEIQIFNEEGASTRHIYLDGRPHPPTLEATSNGHSIGHWEGDTLVVDTVGFNEIGVRMIPGGGMRGARSHSIERMTLIDDGRRLRVEATWDDPKLYAKPNTFTVTHFRMPIGEHPIEGGCDASEARQGKSVQTPKQN